MKPPASISLVVLAVLSLAAATAERPPMGGAAEDKAETYLVYVDPAPPGVPSQAHQFAILAAALGSEEKAKKAMLYNYKKVVSGFSARLTPAELEAVKRQPQVDRAMPSTTLHLMSSSFDGVS
ncbi:hypothetical protein ACP4OV_008519 [Aristida adscensionis]